MKTARLVKVLPSKYQNKALYECHPPIDGHKHVVVQGLAHAYAYQCSIYAADKHGEITDMQELDGLANTVSHEKLLKRIGYTIKK